VRSTSLVMVVVAACSSATEPPRAQSSSPAPPAAPAAPSDTPAKTRDAMKHALAPALEAELDAVRKDPVEAIGYGEKVYRPYEPNTGESLIGSDDPAVTARLLAEAQGSGDRVYRLAVVHLLGMRAGPGVDAALIALLGDRDVSATAAYLLGRAGFKGYPARARDEAAVVAALRQHLDDTSTFDDPFYRRTFRTQDFVLGALVRVLGPERFKTADTRVEDQIGYALPWWSDAVRAELLAQVREAT
jgi:hypothetical protein